MYKIYRYILSYHSEIFNQILLSFILFSLSFLYIIYYYLYIYLLYIIIIYYILLLFITYILFMECKMNYGNDFQIARNIAR